MNLDVFLPDASATDAIAARFAATLPPASVMLHLQGDLGAGKSSFAHALLRALGIQGPIRSPTYTLVERYPLTEGREALHLDLYRIGDPGELEFLGIDHDAVALWLVEWPERGGTALPAPDLRIALAMHGSGRVADLQAFSAIGVDWLLRLGELEELQRFPAAR